MLWADGGEGWCMSSCCGSWVVCKWRFGMPAHFYSTRSEEKLFYWYTVILLQTILNWSTTIVILIFTLYATIMTLYSISQLQLRLKFLTIANSSILKFNLKMRCYILHDVSHSCNMISWFWSGLAAMAYLGGNWIYIQHKKKKKTPHSFTPGVSIKELSSTHTDL